MRLFLAFLFTTFLLVPTITLADAQTGTCIEPRKTPADVGVFLADICGECWSQGNCSINDLMTVVANAGNYILSIVAALVFLMYVAGGFWWVVSHGNSAYVKKGQEWIGAATVGLLIVLVAYTGVVALRSAITTGTLSEGYAICAGDGILASIDDTDGLLCDVNSYCSAYSCLTKCSTTHDGGSCVDSVLKQSFLNDLVRNNLSGSCDTGTSLCPSADQFCCFTELP